MVMTIVFVSMIILSILVITLGFLCKKYSIEENESYLHLRAFGLLLLGAGYVLHTLGDFLSSTYGGSLELALESIAHVIIFVSFIFFVISAKKILAKAEGYWFK